MRSGEEDAFKFIFNALYEKLTAFIAGYTKDQVLAEDIVQHTFMKLWEKRKQLDSNTSLEPFIFKMCRNRFIDLYRTERNTVMLSDELYLNSVLIIEHESPENYDAQKQILKKAVEKLPKKCREVFLLRQNDNLKNKEIAQFLGISEKTVEDHIARAFRLIKKEIFLLVMVWLYSKYF